MVDVSDFDEDGHFHEYFELADRRNLSWRRGLQFTRPLGPEGAKENSPGQVRRRPGSTRIKKFPLLGGEG